VFYLLQKILALVVSLKGVLLHFRFTDEGFVNLSHDLRIETLTKTNHQRCMEGLLIDVAREAAEVLQVRVFLNLIHYFQI